MDLQEFSSPLPKPWLSINADSSNSRVSSAGVSLEQGSVTNLTVSSTLTPAQFAGGIVAVNCSAGSITLNINLPSAASLNTFFGTGPLGLTSYYVECMIYTTVGAGFTSSISIVPGSSVSYYGGGSAPSTWVNLQNTSVSRKIILQFASGVWTLYA